ncbi:hypothetical protein LTS08_007284 [Lithohypha guttulata]|nr:hypothetical protein LTS08_007284 [Lithohypha guttulata]
MEARQDSLAWAKRQRELYAETLHNFASSSDEFQVLYAAANSASSQTVPSPQHKIKDIKTLYVLDSSFNPPTKAHLTLARNALLKDKGAHPARMMFLLATVNADKKPKPAAFEDRLVMMSLMANEITSEFADDKVVVDVAVTKKPFFMDKAACIDEAEIYGDAQQVHLTGFDTIVRIFNAKYYPDDQQLRVLEPFLSKHRLRVCYREDGETSRQEQEAYIEGIGDGSREKEGMKQEWRKMIELVDDAEHVKGISSTESRRAGVEQRTDTLEKLLGKEVAEYVMSERLYRDEEDIRKSGIKPKV